MDLVWKKNPRGRLERKLNLAERERHCCMFSATVENPLRLIYV